jgi:hypothetical protein
MVLFVDENGSCLGISLDDVVGFWVVLLQITLFIEVIQPFDEVRFIG